MDADEDLDVLWCDECRTNHGLDCPKLGSTIKIQDKRVLTRALATLPDSLHVKVIDGSRQVMAALPISRRTQFGPLEARQLDGNLSGGEIFYKIFDSRSVIASLDFSDDNCCNWMSLVPLSADPLLQNLVSFQHKGQIYFLASRNIKEREMLNVWYSPNYAAKMTAATAINDKIQLPSKNVTSEKLSAKIGMVKEEKVWSSSSVHRELEASLISPGHDTSRSSMIEEKHVSSRRGNEEDEENYSEDEDDVYGCDTNTDGSSDEQMKSSSSSTFLLKISSAAREAGEDVMEVKEGSVSQDDIMTHCKKVLPSISSVHKRECCKESFQHQSLQEGKSIFDCSLCQIQRLDAEMFINHMVEVHGASSIDQTETCFRYSCYLCTTVLPSSALLQDHMTSEHKGHMIDPLKCCKCSRVLQNFAELQQHELRHGSLLSVVCHICGERFLKGAMDGHSKERHTGKEGYVCLQCGHMSTTLVDMTGHVRWHDEWNQEGKIKQETGRNGEEEGGLEEEKKLRGSSQLNIESYNRGGGHPKAIVIRCERLDKEKTGGDVKIGRCSDRLPLHDTGSATIGVDQSMSGEKEGGQKGVEGLRKGGRRRQKLEGENRKMKRSKLTLEDGASKRNGEDQNDGEDSEMDSLDDKQKEMLKDPDRRQEGDERKNLGGHNNLSIPKRRYNLRQRAQTVYQNCRGDQESTIGEGIDISDNKETLFNCHLCESEFRSKEKLHNHLGVHLHRKSKAVVGDLQQYPCTECGSVFYSSRSLALHHGRSHKDTRQKCKHCDYKCVAMVTLKEHILSKHKEVDLGIPENFQYPCQDCDVVFLKFFRLTKHMQTHLTKQFKCEKCSHFYSRKDGLQYHTCNPGTGYPGMGIDPQKPSVYTCKYCLKEFDMVKVLNIHVFTHFINVPSKSGSYMLMRVPTKIDKTRTCSHCHGQFNSPTLLVQHVARAHQMKVFPCSLCFDILSSRELLLIHLQNHIESDSDRCEPQSILGSVSACNDCFAVFPNESTLHRHMTVHLKSKDFICDVCGKTFSRKDTLENHLKSHSTSKPYQCEICGKYLKTPQSFQIHIDAHSEERKFQCHVCLRGFKQKGNLNKHMSKCVARRDIRCKYCNLKFRDLSAVTSHEQHIHSSEQSVNSIMY